ncbi:MAG: fibronectin type III domain-containing protein [Armatimonadetes bacterium]|nr:fibronectin type III domain-containing protein [Armatimonadota bacterium]
MKYPTPPRLAQGCYAKDGSYKTRLKELSSSNHPSLIILIALFFLFTGFIAPPSSAQAPGTITTYAGGGNGDGGPAVNAYLRTAYDLDIDAKGNLYIADYDAHRIRKVDAATGLISTFAGAGEEGYFGGGFSGDGGPAVNAELRNPGAVLAGPDGSVFISDRGNNRIRVVDPNGVIRTYAGGGDKGDGSLATEARIYSVTDMAFDPEGHLLLNSYDNGGSGLIWKVDKDTKILSTVVKDLPYNQGITVAKDGTIYVGGGHTMTIYKITPDGKRVHVAGSEGRFGYRGDGGLVSGAQFQVPFDVALDKDGDLYIADTYNGKIRVIADGYIHHVAGGEGYGGGLLRDGGPATLIQLEFPTEIVIGPEGDLYTSSTNGTIWKITPGGKAQIVVGKGWGDDGPATNAAVVQPHGLAWDALGNLYIVDNYSGRYRVRKVAPNGIITTVIGKEWRYPDEDETGDGGPATLGALHDPTGVAVDLKGNIYIVDKNHPRIRKIDFCTGRVTTVAGTGSRSSTGVGDGNGGPATQARLYDPMDVAVDAAGNLYIAEGRQIRKVDAVTKTISLVAGHSSHDAPLGDNGPAVEAKLLGVTGITVDRDGNLLLAVHGQHRIRKVDLQTGIISTVAGSGPFEYGEGGYAGDGGPAIQARLGDPQDVAVDSAGNIYIGDLHGETGRIRKVDAATGIITTVAGNGDAQKLKGSNGDGGPAAESLIGSPRGLTIDVSGHLYISDPFNPYRNMGGRRVRKIFAAAAPGLIAGVPIPDPNAPRPVRPFPPSSATALTVPETVQLGILNGSFATGDLTSWTANGVNGGGVKVEKQGTEFTTAPCSEAIEFPSAYAANVRSNTQGATNSGGILTSDPFIPNAPTLKFKALAESPNVAAKLLILKPKANALNPAASDILLQQDLSFAGETGVRAPFREFTVDVSAFHNAASPASGVPMRLQIRQGTTEAGQGHFTLFTGFEAGAVAELPVEYEPPAGSFPPPVIEEEPQKDPSGLEFLRLGLLEISADKIEQMTKNPDGTVFTYELKGNAAINQFLRFGPLEEGGAAPTVKATLNVPAATVELEMKSGSIFLDGIPSIDLKNPLNVQYGKKVLWRGESFKFKVDASGQVAGIQQAAAKTLLQIAGVNVGIEGLRLTIPRDYWSIREKIRLPDYGGTYPSLKLPDGLGVRIDGNFQFPEVPGIQGLTAKVEKLYIDRKDGIRFSGDVGLPPFEMGGFGVRDVKLKFIAGETPDRDLFEGQGMLVTPPFNVLGRVKFIAGSLDSVYARVEGNNGNSVPLPPFAITAGEIGVSNLRQGPFALHIGADLTVAHEWLAKLIKLSHASVDYTWPDKIQGSSDLDILTAKVAAVALGIEPPYKFHLGGNVELIDSFKVFLVNFDVNAGVNHDGQGHLVNPYFNGYAQGIVQIPNGSGFPYNIMKAKPWPDIALPYKLLDAGLAVQDGVFSYWTEIYLAELLGKKVELELNAKVKPDGLGVIVQVGTNWGNLPAVRVGLLTDEGGTVPLSSGPDSNAAMLAAMGRDRESMGDNPLEGNGLYIPADSSPGGFRPLQSGPLKDLAKITVAPKTPQTIFRLYAEAGAPTFYLKKPDGTLVTPENAQQHGILFTQNAEAKESYYIVSDPAAGDWIVQVESSATGPFVVDGWGAKNTPALNSVNAAMAGASVASITYNAADPDGDAKVSLYADTDAEGYDGSLIAKDLPASTDGSYQWVFDGGAIPAGDYFVYAVADDGTTTPVRKYASAKVTVIDPKAPAAPQNVTVQPGPENSLLVTWTPSPEAGIEGYQVRYGVNTGIEAELKASASAGDATSLRLTKLANDTEYRVEVVAVKTEVVNPDDPATRRTVVHTSAPSVAAVGKTGAAVAPKVALTAPVGGETWHTNRAQTVAWTVVDGDDLSDQQVELSTDGGATWRPLKTHLPGSARTWTWDVPAGLKSATARLRVSALDAAGNAGSDASKADLTLGAAPPTITAASPEALDLDLPGALLINGSDFSPGATVKLGSRTLSAAYLNGGAISAAVPEPATASRGTTTLTVTNPDGQFATLTVTIGRGEPGDVNRDTRVNVTDAIWVLQHIVEVKTLTAEELLLADLKADGAVNVGDVVAILRKAVGLPI